MSGSFVYHKNQTRTCNLSPGGLWDWFVRPGADCLISKGSFHPKTACSALNLTFAKWVLLANGHRIMFPRLVSKHIVDFPLPYSRHFIWKIYHRLPQAITSYTKMNGRQLFALQTMGAHGNRPLNRSGSVSDSLPKEFKGIREVPHIGFLKTYKNRYTVPPNNKVNRGRLHMVRRTYYNIPMRDVEQETIPTAKPITPRDVGKSFSQTLPSRQNGTIPLGFLLTPLKDPIQARDTHDILRHHSLRILDQRILRIEYKPTVTAQAKSRVSLSKSSLDSKATDLIQAVGEALNAVHESKVFTPITADSSPIPSKKSSGPKAETTVITPSVSNRWGNKRALTKLKIKRDHWTFFPINLLLLALTVYLMFNSYQTILHARSLYAYTLPPASTDSQAPNILTSKPPSLKVYRAIWQKDLFHEAAIQNLKGQEKISVEDVPYAQKDLGLVLIGTIASDDPDLSRAIITNRGMKQHIAYREGEHVGEVKIKKILLGQVIISTEDGNKLLAVEHEDSRRKQIVNKDEINPDEDSIKERQALKKRKPTGKQRAKRLRASKRNGNADRRTRQLAAEQILKYRDLKIEKKQLDPKKVSQDELYAFKKQMIERRQEAKRGRYLKRTND